MKDSFGDRMKEYERMETGRRFLPLLPVYARIDGRSFSSFTRDMKRPYDTRMSEIMQETTRWLVQETSAVMGYTQSDEISLAWYSDDHNAQIFFDGKIFKMTSMLAAMTTAKFLLLAQEVWPEKCRNKPPVFDARVFSLPNRVECANAFLWREKDATKNAISMAARSVYSHKQLHGKSGREMVAMLADKDVDFEAYPAFFKRGTFFQRRKELRELSPQELERIPPDHRPTGPIERAVVKQIDMPKFATVSNRVAVVFDGAEPQTAAPPPGLPVEQ